MTAEERFTLIRTKIERAKQHLHDLEVARNGFIISKPYRIERENDPQTVDITCTAYSISKPLTSKWDLLPETLSTTSEAPLTTLPTNSFTSTVRTRPSKPLIRSGIVPQNTKPNEPEE